MRADEALNMNKRRRPRFLPTFFWLLARQKQHILAISRQAKKGKGKKQKWKTKIGRAFFGRKSALFPQF